MSTRCLDCHRLVPRGPRCQQCAPNGNSRGWRWSKVIVPAVLERDGHQCVRCGRPCPHPQHHDVNHIRPKAQGGTDDMANLETLCRGANRGKKECEG